AQVIDRPGDLAVRGIQPVVAGLDLGRDLGQGGLGDHRPASQKTERGARGGDAGDGGAGVELHEGASVWTGGETGNETAVATRIDVVNGGGSTGSRATA